VQTTFLSKIRFPIISRYAQKGGEESAQGYEVVLPELTISSSASHRPKKEFIDFNDFQLAHFQRLMEGGGFEEAPFLTV